VWPQAPQFDELVRVLISQPLLATPSQSAKPAVHDEIAQLDALQVGVALASEHFLPHAPQLFGSPVTVLISHPLVATPSQSAYPLAHETIAQFEEVQAAVALASEHFLPHAPQLLVSPLAVLISHPLVATPSQSA
jgi:hypothetical protein